jgi:hypothetical protein
MKRLVSDAMAAGLWVDVPHDGSDGEPITIRKGKSTHSVGITIWPDGTATRSDVAFELTTTIRTQKEMRAILGLKGA